MISHMTSQEQTPMVIQRRPLNTSPSARLNSYNHHALAPWLAETGYLTPSYLARREQEIAPFNMGRWLTPQIQECMLNQPATIQHFTKDEVRQLLEVAAELNFDTAKAEKSDGLSELAAEMEQKTKGHPDATSAGYFIRTSHCSPKDADGGNLQPVNNIREALVKLVSSKRTVQALLSLFYQLSQDANSPDNQLYFFPYYTDLDRLSEWRCYVKEGRIVAISQSRFYQPNHGGITDEMLGRLATQARHLWSRIAPDLNFKSCILDVYAEVLDSEFEVKLIEINPWGAHSGSGSLLFHWLDDADILDPRQPDGTTAIRLVECGEAKALTRDEAFQIGRGGIIEDELRCLRERGLEWVLEDDRHAEFMGLPVPDGQSGLTTRKDGLEIFRKGLDGDVMGVKPRNHPRFLKLKRVYEANR
ncbi:hypothetical protein CPAR01_07065 [Colletotrichum paranaense]|uniref:Cell division cycle protein 123 n=1 Tax=Colletotrichum paranaense TaxID=1914294 RepID=A0ABQ9SNJ0_9PEZI|nr:uncharacterized protein CPAR01_07065 [Colletotrichum paranaense]KAK1541076.1 hypothetical protein CPAR01_07065 [Colletotrichum paranaense]